MDEKISSKRMVFYQKDTKYYILFFLMFVKYLFPYYLNYKIEKNVFFDGVVTLIPIGLMVLFQIHMGKIKESIMVLVTIYLTLTLSTTINGGNLVPVISHSIQVILICMCLDHIVVDSLKLNMFLLAIRDITFLFFTTHLLLLIFIPMGIAEISKPGEIPFYFYGNVNTPFKYVLVGLCASLIIDARRNNRLSVQTIILFIGPVYSAITVYFTATAVVGEIVVVLWILGGLCIRKHVWRKYVMVFVVGFLFELFVVLHKDISRLIVFITSTLNKDVTLSGRTFLWKNAFSLFLKQPLFGYGLQNEEKIGRYIGNSNGCHNYYLDILYQRGILGMGILLFLFLLPILRGWQKPVCSKEIYLLLGVCVSWAVMFLTEPFYGIEKLFIPMFYVILSSFSHTWFKFKNGT